MTRSAPIGPISSGIRPGWIQQDHCQVVQHGRFQAAGGRIPRQLGRGIMRLPGINNWDTGLFKNFRITERVSLAVPVRVVQYLEPHAVEWSGS